MGKVLRYQHVRAREDTLRYLFYTQSLTLMIIYYAHIYTTRMHSNKRSSRYALNILN